MVLNDLLEKREVGLENQNLSKRVPGAILYIQ